MGACVSSQPSVDSISIESMEAYVSAPLSNVVAVRTPLTKHRSHIGILETNAFPLLSLPTGVLKNILELMDQESLLSLPLLSKKAELTFEKCFMKNPKFDKIVLDD